MKPNLLKHACLTLAGLLAAVICNAQDPGPGSGTTILDSFMAIIIILFIISMIVEKITQLIRKYAPFIKPHQQKGAAMKTLGSFWRNINRPQDGTDAEQDKRVEREVVSLSLMVGILVAVAFRVDLFEMFRSPDPRNVLFWSGGFGYSTVWQILGFILSIGLTGFFLTFGSKFFHDLLDLLFQVKQLKKKAVDENTFKADTIEQFDEFMARTHADVIETAIQQNQALLNPPNLLAPPMHGKTMKDGKLVDCIDIHLAGAGRGNIPFQVQAKLEKGQVVHVPVNVVDELDMPKAQAGQGDSIAATGTPNFRGTVCCKVKRNADDREALLTCSHVMAGGSNKNFFGTLAAPVNGLVGGATTGQFFWAFCNDQLDVALLQPADNTFQYQVAPGDARRVSVTDMGGSVKVVRQQGRGISQGRIINYRVPMPIKIQYSEGVFGVRNLMLLSTVTTSDQGTSYVTLTDEGDSGACVYDSQDNPIGMIVAGNNKFSYAMPIVDVLFRANSSLIK